MNPNKAHPILLVDDDPNFRKIVHLTLEMLGYTVLTAGGAAAAEEIAARTQDIRLLITDVEMPAMNGAQLARKIREIHPAVHVLYISGFPLQAMPGMGVTTDAGHFLQKPFPPAVIEARIKALLAGA